VGSFGCSGGGGMLQNYRKQQQDSDQAKYDQREHTHYENWHRLTSLPEIVSPG